MYVCMFVRTCVRTCVFMYVFTHACKYVYKYVSMYVRMYVCMYFFFFFCFFFFFFFFFFFVCLFVCVCTFVRMYVYMYVFMHLCVCSRTHANIQFFSQLPLLNYIFVELSRIYLVGSISHNSVPFCQSFPLFLQNGSLQIKITLGNCLFLCRNFGTS